MFRLNLIHFGVENSQGQKKVNKRAKERRLESDTDTSSEFELDR